MKIVYLIVFSALMALMAVMVESKAVTLNQNQMWNKNEEDTIRSHDFTIPYVEENKTLKPLKL